MKLKINKNIDYSEGYEKIGGLTSREKETPDGWRSRNSFDVNECQLKLKEDIKLILNKYGQNNRT